MNQETDELLFVTKEEQGERIDKILANRFRTIKSRTYFQYLIEEQKVQVNGESIKKRYIPKEGDEIGINFILTPEIGLEPENIPLDIIFEDSDLIVVNKPPGMVVHPAVGNWTGTFVNALLYHCKQLNETKEKQDLRPGIVHRLDKDTSGLIIAAKNSLAQQRLIEMFSSRQIHKEYIAICLGKPGDVEVSAPIGRHSVNRQLMTVREDGRSALSILKTLKYNEKMSVVKVLLMTGRTHQIRVHLKYLGTPVLGDVSYGNKDANLKFKLTRQLLHASLLRFQHPIKGDLLEFVAPLPMDMQDFIQANALV